MLGVWDKKSFFDLVQGLAKAPGPSFGEGPRRKVLEDFFSRAHVPWRMDSAGNLMVTLGSGPWGDTVVFDAHMDVVQNGFTDTVVFEQEKMIGMGLADNLTAVTLLSLAARDLHRQNRPLARPLLMLFSVCEEGHGNLMGIKQVINDCPGPPYAFISFDLSFEEYSVSALGSIRYSLEIHCPGGHSWEAYGSPGAIDMMMDFFSCIKTKFNELLSAHSGALSFNVGTVQGGEGINSIARTAKASFEFRSVSRDLLAVLDLEVSGIAEKLNARDGVDVRCDVTGTRPAARAVQAERIEPLVLDILSRLGEKTRPVVRSTNINATLDAGWPSLCMGLCTSGNFHTASEYVVLDSIEKGWRLLSMLTKGLVL